MGVASWVVTCRGRGRFFATFIGLVLGLRRRVRAARAGPRRFKTAEPRVLVADPAKGLMGSPVLKKSGPTELLQRVVAAL